MFQWNAYMLNLHVNSHTEHRQINKDMPFIPLKVLFYHKHTEVKVTQSCPTLCNPMGYTVHGILQARLFRYELNQITYNYTMEMRNRFKGLDQIDRVPEELWMKVCDTVQEAGIKTIPKKKEGKQAKWLSEEALQIVVKRRSKKQRRKGKIYPFECRVPKNSKEI